MGKFIDLTDEKFVRLKVIRRIENGKNGETRWRCQCDCGNTLEVNGHDLRRGDTKSCGCLCFDVLTTHNMSKTRQYETWASLLTRCKNPSSEGYKNYGGRGITVCKKWLTFEGFWEDMQEGYSDELTIDRKDNNAGYFKDNCRWATKEQQNNNRRNTLHIEINGETKTLLEWAEKVGINYHTLYHRINSHGYSGEDIIKPVKVGGVCHQ